MTLAAPCGDHRGRRGGSPTASTGTATVPTRPFVPPDEPVTFEGLVDAVLELPTYWTTVGRDQEIARYESTLEATRRPELRDSLDRTSTRIRELGSRMLRGVVGSHAPLSARRLAPILDGIVFQCVTADDPPPLDRRQLAALIGAELGRLPHD